jgi:hypothetical protein
VKKITQPAIGADCDRVAATMVGAIDKHPAHAHVAHLSEGDLLRAVSGGHA